MTVFDKNEIKEALNLENIFEVLQEFGGEPEYSSFGILSSTICHNLPGEGSRKLYFYSNSMLFRCYTDCGEYFDIFQLVMKIAKIQWNEDYDLNDAVLWIAHHFGFSGSEVADEQKLLDWKVLEKYENIEKLEIKNNEITLKEYDEEILNRFNYSAKIMPWIQEGISEEVLKQARIGFYPGGDQITIPHFDINNRFIGLRGRSLSKLDCDLYGKYRPLKVNKKWYNHPLGYNLYGLNQSKDNIKLMRKAIVFEGEKSQLLYSSYFGIENNISVACCGSSLSYHQIQLLLKVGAEEIVIAFDRQFQEIGDKEFIKLKSNLLKIRDKYKQDAIVSFIFDSKMLTEYKDSPIDKGPEIFLQLFKERIIL